MEENEGRAADTNTHLFPNEVGVLVEVGEDVGEVAVVTLEVVLKFFPFVGAEGPEMSLPGVERNGVMKISFDARTSRTGL